jgi:zinc protease
MKIKILSVFMILVFIAPVFAQKQTPPEGGKPKDFVLPEKQEKSLSNGLSAVLVPFGKVPKVTISAIVKTGNLHEGPQEVWLNDLMGRMMREGAAGMNFQTIAHKAASMGGEISVDVSSTDTEVSISVLSEFAPDAIQLVSDVLTKPTFPESEIARHKNDLKRELNVQKSVPQSLAAEKFAALMYPDQPYGRMFPTAEMIDAYDIQKVRDYYQKNFGGKRTKVYVVGSFAQDRALSAIEKAFGSWTAGPEVNYPTPNPQAKKQVASIDRSGAPQTTLILGTPVLGPTDPNFVPFSVSNALLAGSFGSRITRNIREDKGYTYSPHGTVRPRFGVSVWAEEADVTSEHTADSIVEIKKEIKRLQIEPPTADEVKGIENYVAGLFVLRNSSPDGIIAQLHYQDLYHLPDDYLSTYVKRVYAVTAEQIQELIKSQLKTDQMTLVMVGDKKYTEPAGAL